MRLPGWEAKLSTYIESRRRRPFEWGAHDCATFAAGAVEAITGGCPFIDAHTHNTALQAERVLRRLGCSDVIDWAILSLGDPLDITLMAQRGDVVGFDGSHGPTLGVCVGSSFAGPGPEGLVFLPMQHVAYAWRV